MRVIRYRQHKPDGTVVEADWITGWPTRRAGSLSLYRMAKSRWEIENQGFNDAKNHYGLEHICHHQADSILLNWLISFLALVKLKTSFPVAFPPSALHNLTLPTPSGARRTALNNSPCLRRRLALASPAGQPALLCTPCHRSSETAESRAGRLTRGGVGCMFDSSGSSK